METAVSYTHLDVYKRQQRADSERQDHRGQRGFPGDAHLAVRRPVLSGGVHHFVQSGKDRREEGVLWKVKSLSGI